MERWEGKLSNLGNSFCQLVVDRAMVWKCALLGVSDVLVQLSQGAVCSSSHLPAFSPTLLPPFEMVLMCVPIWPWI